MPDWFEDESFWEATYPYLFSQERMEAGTDQVQRLLALVGGERRATLDLACGPGRHAIPLAKRGCCVTAVDRSRFLLDRARVAARDEGVDVEWVEEDMRRFRRDSAFDLAISMFTSFGFFENEGDDRQVLENIHAGLIAGGAFLIDVVGKEWVAKNFQPTSAAEFADGTVLIERREILDGWSRIRNDWTLLKGERARTYRFELTLYSGKELRDLLESVGFSRARVVGDLDGSPYGLDAKRLIAVAWK